MNRLSYVTWHMKILKKKNIGIILYKYKERDKKKV